MINICLLGATGSIGRQTIEVVSKLDGYQIYSCSTNTRVDLLKEIMPKSVKEVAVTGLSNANLSDVLVYKGCDSILKLIESENVDVVVNALVGSSGLLATIAALKNHKKLLLANKESLVLAGEIVEKVRMENDGVIIPIDSEHSAIRKCLEEGGTSNIDSITITASGGALRDLRRDELENIKVDDVLKHPTWKMGPKITVDCSTMVNKGLEVIEAHHLFKLPYDKIKTVLHYESYVHGIVNYKDKSLMFASNPTMLIPIEYAITGKCNIDCLDYNIENTKDLTFKEMDLERFPMLSLAYKVGKMGGIMPAVYSTANEVAVNKFLNGEIKYLDIEKIIQTEVERYSEKNILDYNLQDVLDVIKEINERY